MHLCLPWPLLRRSLSVVTLLLLGLPAAQAAPVAAPSLRACSSLDLTGYAPPAAEVAAHRKGPLPTLHYPFGSAPEGGRWGLLLTLRVNESGQVLCYRLKDSYGKEQPLNEQRREMLEQVKSWHYSPFQQGRPVAAVLAETILEDELPQQVLPLPEAPLESVRLRLQRQACEGMCPVYSVEINGDGSVIYKGSDYVDVQGEHRYQVPQTDVAGLVEKLKTNGVWSLRRQYSARAPDAPTVVLTMRIGSAEHSLVDRLGTVVGMPAAVDDFEDEIDRVARTSMWIALSPEGLAHLKAEGFRFQSREAGALLARAVTAGRDEAVLLDLVKLGAPLDSPLDPDERLHSDEPASLLEEALLNGQAALVDLLIQQGALQSRGKVDAGKLDAAFRAAIAGGRLALVQKIWNAGDGRHPALTFPEASESGWGTRPTSVALLLSPAREEQAWEGLPIVEWLSAQGASLKDRSMDGITLLHVAIAARDKALVRYLTAQGLKDTAQGNGPTVLQSAQDEDSALMLLESGASQPPRGEAGRQYQMYVQTRRWNRVAEWLKAHPQ